MACLSDWLLKVLKRFMIPAVHAWVTQTLPKELPQHKRQVNGAVWGLFITFFFFWSDLWEVWLTGSKSLQYGLSNTNQMQVKGLCVWLNTCGLNRVMGRETQVTDKTGFWFSHHSHSSLWIFHSKRWNRNSLDYFLFCFAAHDVPGLGPFPLTVQSQCIVHA